MADQEGVVSRAQIAARNPDRDLTDIAPQRILKTVLVWLRRAVALLSVLTLVQGALVQCAGWQAAPEARRQCCQSGACARHEGVNAASQEQISQAAVPRAAR